MHIVGHGIDLVSIERIGRLLSEHQERFLERCFTAHEQMYFSDVRNAPGHAAARFAAKEAVLKALGTGLTGGIQWTDIEVRRDAMGKPGILLRGKAAEVADSLGITGWHVSLTHADGFASASVIAVGEGTSQGPADDAS